MKKLFRTRRSTRSNSPIRLTVNLSRDVAKALVDLSAKHGVTITEGIRRAIALLHLIVEARSKGQRVVVVDPNRETYREVTFTP